MQIYLEMLNNIKADSDRWISLPNSLRAHVSVVKMNIFPRINFISSMIPLSPPVNYWNKIHSIVSQFIWNRKQPRLNLSTTQRGVASGGLSVPNFKFYFWSFVLRPLIVWCDSDALVSWRKLEENCVRPWNLQEVLFANISSKQCRVRFGPIVSQLIQTWRAAELQCKISCKWHTLTPIFNNHGLLIGGRPISCPTLRNSNIRIFADLYSDTGLRNFQDFRDRYNLPANSFFFYLQLRSS